jgi:hypothetical protein
MTTFSDQLLDHSRQQGDPLADEAVRKLMDERGQAAAGQLFARLIRAVEMPLEELPASLQDYWTQSRPFPDWAEAERIARAQALFLDHGPKLLLILYFKSLPLLYSCAKGAAVLVRTARLTHQGADAEIFSRRIAETAQFLLGVMAPDALRPDGPALPLIQKVRLIHAGIRQMLLAEGWEEGAFDHPINQEDLAITLCSFGISAIDGLAQMGILLPKEQVADYVHCWRVIGHLLGINEHLLADDPGTARQLEARILSRQANSSEAGQLLATALVQFSARYMPFEQAEVSPLGLVQFFGGTERLRHLQLQPNYGCIAWIVPEFMSAYFRKGEQLEGRSSPMLQALLHTLSERTMLAMVDFFDHYKDRSFELPDSLRQAWRLPKK